MPDPSGIEAVDGDALDLLLDPLLLAGLAPHLPERSVHLAVARLRRRPSRELKSRGFVFGSWGRSVPGAAVGPDVGDPALIVAGKLVERLPSGG